MNITLSTQPLTQNPPLYFLQNPSLINQNPPSSLPTPPNPSDSQLSISNLQSTSYNPYVSLHPGFQSYPTNSFQPPNNPPNHLPPSNSTLPFNLPSSYPSPPFQMPPSVPFAALSDPIKLFDGIYNAFSPEIFLPHLSARVSIQLGPQPVDIQSYLTWYSRRVYLLYCSSTGTASNWYDRLPRVYKVDWSYFLQVFKKQFYYQKHAYHAHIEAISLVKKDNENVRHYALKVETLVKQGRYNEYPSTINPKCNGIFTRGLSKN